MTYQAALFDLDGTLIDSISFHAACFQRFFRGYGLTFSLEKVKSLMGNTIQVILNNTLPQALHDEAIERLTEFYRTEADDLIQQIPVLPEVLETLEILRQAGMPLFLVSNSKQELVQKILPAHGLNFFRRVVGADRDSLDKASRCSGLLSAWGLVPERVLYIGDSGGDVELSRTVGMNSCLILNRFSWIHKEGVDLKSVCPDYTVHRFSEILPILLAK